MIKSIIKVDGMSCEHCVKTVTKAVNALPGIGALNVDLKNKTVTVEHEPTRTTLDKIEHAIEDEGYDILN